jgi:hypothetical protein
VTGQFLRCWLLIFPFDRAHGHVANIPVMKCGIGELHKVFSEGIDPRLAHESSNLFVYKALYEWVPASSFLIVVAKVESRPCV